MKIDGIDAYTSGEYARCRETRAISAALQTLPAQIEVNKSFESAKAEFLANARLQGDLDAIYLEAMRTAQQKLLSAGMAREADLT